jgi:hypothetical protein
MSTLYFIVYKLLAGMRIITHHYHPILLINFHTICD